MKKITLLFIPFVLIVCLLAIPVSADSYTPTWPAPDGIEYMTAVTPVNVGSTTNVNGYTYIITAGSIEAGYSEVVLLEFANDNNFFLYDEDWYSFRKFYISATDGYTLMFEDGNGDVYPFVHAGGVTLLLADYPPFTSTDDSFVRDYWAVALGGYINPERLAIKSVVDPDATAASSVTSVWSRIMTWIVSAIGSAIAVFYVDGSLTFIGGLSVLAVAVAVAFLLIGIIQRFLKLRG